MTIDCTKLIKFRHPGRFIYNLAILLLMSQVLILKFDSNSSMQANDIVENNYIYKNISHQIYGKYS